MRLMSRLGFLYFAFLFFALSSVHAEKIDNGIMIFDTRNGRFAGSCGYISVDTPGLGRVARFDEYLARYIGFGNWG